MYKIPEAIKSEDAASMWVRAFGSSALADDALCRLCGGLTVYSPLVRNNIGPGKKVGVVGLGGL